ncbi:MAG: prolipoprotein diacylglyceryl transferase [Elusimicrobia bacterium]|nr:prolipoprotein diacylglyceryl transferase [Elusimicrobiota bacterium]
MLPVLIQFGPLRIATYGLLVATAYLVGVLWLKAQRERMGLSESEFWRLIYSIFFGAIIGGKILFVALNWGDFASGSMGILRDFRYGFVFFGGFLGATLSGGLYARRIGKDFLRQADFFAVATPLGHWIGRLGCLAAGCCYGRPTSLPWAIRFTHPAALVENSLVGVPLHPAQLYEAAGELAIAFVLYRVLNRIQRGAARRGCAFLGFLVLYSALRFCVEFFRGDDRGAFWLDLSPSQWIALACALAAGGFAWRQRNHD